MKKRALISVFDKDKIIDFSRKLESLGWEIISTGGTFNMLTNAGIKAIEVDKITNFPEILNGRVKTLHPFVHAGILYKRDDKKHKETVENLGISSIDMVVNNLYPFEEILKKNIEGAIHSDNHEELIENIDIGGPSMIRAAAKNYKDVIIVTDTHDYDMIIEKLEKDTMDEHTKKILSCKAFNYTAYYDAMIARYFNDSLDIDFPEKLTITYNKKQTLRYGENPHQKGAFYERVGINTDEFKMLEQLHGKELSYNNFNDIYSAVKFIKEFTEPAVVGIKHSNPSGLAVSTSIEEAFDKAFHSDPISIFGGIIALNREVTTYVAEKINEIFIEVVIAPDFSKKALEILTQKKNIRIIKVPNILGNIEKMTIKQVLNGILYQENNNQLFLDNNLEVLDKNSLNCVTNRKPNKEELEDLIFAWKVCKHVSSNGIVLAKDLVTVGIGQGEVRRSWAVENAVKNSAEMGSFNLEGTVMASDAFFFEDTIEILKENNIRAVIQPGGSIKDKLVIELANKYNIAMIFTEIRHFRH